MGNAQVLCLLKGIKKRPKTKRRKDISCMSETATSEIGFQLTNDSTAWLCKTAAEHREEPLRGCAVSSYKTLQS